MAWTKVRCNNCEKDYEVQMYGPHKTRDWKAANWRGICDDCKEAAKVALVVENKEGDLPELTGSDKQIAWAMKIRKDAVNNFKALDKEDVEMIIEDCMDHGIDADQTIIDAAIDQLLENTSAHWWIDTARNELEIELIVGAIAEIHKSVPAKTDADLEKELKADVEAEAVMSPHKSNYRTIADIKFTDKKITISFKERNEDFKKIVKNHGFRWDSPWTKKLSYATESYKDRVAEIGVKLMTAGFSIRVIDPDIRQKIISANFQPEHTRWISVLTNKPNHFYIHWTYGDDIYSEAKRISGSRYSRPGVVVPMEQLDEIQDFADIYQFKFSPAALRLICRTKKNKEAALVVNVQGKESQVPPAAQSGMPKLSPLENVEVDDELKD